jgi:predicted DNA repair protein MutK
MTNEQPKELGCLAEGAIVAEVYIIIFWVIIPLVFGVIINGLIPLVVAVAIVGWLLTRKYRKNMEKRLGRKVRGDHELTSISSWMEVSAKDEAARAAPVHREMNPPGKGDKPEG